MNPFRSARLWTCLAGACLMPVIAYPAHNQVKTTAHYNVSSRGFSIGDVTTSQLVSEEGGATVHFETKTVVKASFLWMGYQLDTIEKGTILKQNLTNYSRKGQENGIAVDVEGKLENEAFRFEVREQGAVRSIVVPRNSYDYTTMECPEAKMDFSTKPLVTVRVLDVEKMVVVKRNYRLVRTTHYTIAGKDHPCRVVDFSDQNKMARRWIAWDGSAVVMYRQDGSGEKNSYSVQATSVTKGI